MPLQKPKLVLLPGLDGTGDLFCDFVSALPDVIEVTVVRYPIDVCLPYAQLAELVTAAVPATEPFVLLAESYSTPLAIQYAAIRPANLKGLILCAGFASSPVKGWMRSVCFLIAPIVFRTPSPGFAVKFLLVGSKAPASLLAAVKKVKSLSHSGVPSDRLRQVIACDVREELSRVLVPVLYIRARQDRLVRGICLKEILEIHPETAVVTVSGPHLILQREPRLTAEIVAKFIEQVG